MLGASLRTHWCSAAAAVQHRESSYNPGVAAYIGATECQFDTDQIGSEMVTQV